MVSVAAFAHSPPEPPRLHLYLAVFEDGVCHIAVDGFLQLRLRLLELVQNPVPVIGNKFQGIGFFRTPPFMSGRWKLAPWLVPLTLTRNW